MAFFSQPANPRDLAFERTPRRGFFVRLYAALILSRQRTAERELGRYLVRTGKLTDQMERDIERSVFGQSSSFDWRG